MSWVSSWFCDFFLSSVLFCVAWHLFIYSYSFYCPLPSCFIPPCVSFFLIWTYYSLVGCKLQEINISNLRKCSLDQFLLLFPQPEHSRLLLNFECHHQTDDNGLRWIMKCLKHRWAHKSIFFFLRLPSDRRINVINTGFRPFSFEWYLYGPVVWLLHLLDAWWMQYFALSPGRDVVCIWRLEDPILPCFLRQHLSLFWNFPSRLQGLPGEPWATTFFTLLAKVAIYHARWICVFLGIEVTSSSTLLMYLLGLGCLWGQGITR